MVSAREIVKDSRRKDCEDDRRETGRRKEIVRTVGEKTVRTIEEEEEEEEEEEIVRTVWTVRTIEEKVFFIFKN